MSKLLPRNRIAAVLGVLAVLSSLAFAQPAAAVPGGVKLHVAYNQKCLEADLGHIHENGDRVQLWDCYNDPGNQQWSLEPSLNGTFKIVNVLANKCLDADLGGGGNGTRVQLWDCLDDPGNQHWRISPDGPAHTVMNYHWSNLALDADLGNINANGARVQLWVRWNDPGNQFWVDSRT